MSSVAAFVICRSWISHPVFEYRYSPAGVEAAKTAIGVEPDRTVTIPEVVLLKFRAPRTTLLVSPEKVVVVAVVMYL